jgi:hypothetical protein
METYLVIELTRGINGMAVRECIISVHDNRGDATGLQNDLQWRTRFIWANGINPTLGNKYVYRVQGMGYKVNPVPSDRMSTIASEYLAELAAE